MRAFILFDTAMDDFHVSRPIADIAENTRTEIAWKFFCPRMIIHMYFQFVASDFAQTTQWTHMVFDTIVSHHMLFQFVFGGIFLRANLTSKWH